MRTNAFDQHKLQSQFEAVANTINVDQVVRAGGRASTAEEAIKIGLQKLEQLDKKQGRDTLTMKRQI